jgi:hypothetical protein
MPVRLGYSFFHRQKGKEDKEGRGKETVENRRGACMAVVNTTGRPGGHLIYRQTIQPAIVGLA